MFEKIRSLRMNKYLALGLVCALLLLLCVLLPVGRRAEPAPAVPASTAAETAPPPSTELPAPVRPSGLREIGDLTLLPGETVLGLCPDGDAPAALLQRWDPEGQVWRSRLVRLDPARATVDSVLELEPIGESASLAVPVLSETEIRLVDEDGERCAAFDRSGRFLGLKDHPVMSGENLGWRNVLLSDGCFRKDRQWAEFSRSDSGSLNRVVAFYDESDRVHVVAEPYDGLRAVRGHRLLSFRFGEGGSVELALLDLDASLCLDRLTLEPEGEEEYCNLSAALMGEDWVLLAVTRDGPDTTESSLCLWYPEAGRESPLETELLTEQSLTDGVEALRQSLEQAGLSLHLDEAPAPELTPTTGLSSFENRCETGASLYGQYWILRSLSEFVQKLPAGMIPELTAALPGDEAEDGGLQVYLVRNIPGDAAAFANAWSVPALICFATEEFGPSHLAHEFMHIMDLRLLRWMDSRGRDLEEEWMSLSPPYAYEEDLSPEQNEAVEPCFVSWYARTNSAEDRAETFQEIFDCEGPVEELWWYPDHPGVLAKARWLTQTIREAFPSVQAQERAWWEKLPAEAE